MRIGYHVPHKNTMKFCGLCDNTMYIRVVRDRDQHKLEQYCKFCGATDQCVGDERADSVCVLETCVQDEDENEYRRYMTPYLKYDPTLPRRDNIACPKCSVAKGSSIQAHKVIVVFRDDRAKWSRISSVWLRRRRKVSMKFVSTSMSSRQMWRAISRCWNR